VEQAVYMVTKKNKGALLQSILNEKGQVSTLVFSRTKHGANKIVKVLNKQGFRADAIHGNKSQASRQRSLRDFKDGKVHILVATDIAARGIDVDDLALVVNYDLPNIPETYVHRIGRTGRAAASGIALSFCNGEERAFLRDIEKLIKQKVPVITEHDFVDDSPEPTAKELKEAKRLKNENRGRGRSQGRSSRDDRNGPKKKRPNKRRDDNRSERSDEKREDRRKKDDRRNQPKGERSNDRNSDQKPKDGKPRNKRRNDRDGKPREDRKDQKPRSSKPGDKKSSNKNNNRRKKSKDGITKTERKFREGQKKTSDYKGRYRPKGTMWELD